MLLVSQETEDLADAVSQETDDLADADRYESARRESTAAVVQGKSPD